MSLLFVGQERSWAIATTAVSFSDRVFFLIAALILVTAVGFSETYYLNGLFHAPLPSRVTHAQPALRECLAFQIRSSWAQFLRFSIFELLDFSITYVFSTSLNIPTPPASTICKSHIVPMLSCSLRRLFGKADAAEYSLKAGMGMQLPVVGVDRKSDD
jgi:hypothetical protein